MAVYTEVTDEELEAFVAEYDIGEALACKGIAEGIENSNFILTTTTGPFILTLYEKRVQAGDLPFFLGLLDHLAGKGVPCPTPVKGRDGVVLRKLAGRPAAIQTFLAGMWPRRVTPDHCRDLGGALAAFHLAGQDYGVMRKNTLGVHDWRPLLDQCLNRADEVKAGLADQLDKELAEIEAGWPEGLPEGIIHADLFPDNVFFRSGHLSGLIDFYFACHDAFAYDLAICLNAWCFEKDLSFNVTKAKRLLASYRQVRDFSDDELQALPLLARGAAMRFLLTRLYDWLNPSEDAYVTPKNPLEYWEVLKFHRGIKGPGAYGLE